MVSNVELQWVAKQYRCCHNADSKPFELQALVEQMLTRKIEGNVVLVEGATGSGSILYNIAKRIQNGFQSHHFYQSADDGCSFARLANQTLQSPLAIHGDEKITFHTDKLVSNKKG